MIMHHDSLGTIAGRRILLIEDELAVRESLRRYFERFGASVIVAPHGEDGIRVMRESAVDVVVSDISLPGLSGLDLRRSIRARWPGVPVILMTGALASDVPQGELADWELLLKPFDLTHLGSAVVQALATRAG